MRDSKDWLTKGKTSDGAWGWDDGGVTIFAQKLILLVTPRERGVGLSFTLDVHTILGIFRRKSLFRRRERQWVHYCSRKPGSP